MPGSKLISVIGAPGSKLLEVSQTIALKSGTECSIIDLEWYRKTPLVNGEFSLLQVTEAVGYHSFDPSCYDLDRLAEDLHKLKLGDSVLISSSNPAEDSDSDNVINEEESIYLQPASLIIVSGAFALHTIRLKKLADRTVFVDSDLEQCFERLRVGNSLAATINEESARTQWNNSVVPKFNGFVLPLRDHVQHLITRESIDMGGDLSHDEMFDNIIEQFRLFAVSADSSAQPASNSAVNSSQQGYGFGVGHFGFGC